MGHPVLIRVSPGYPDTKGGLPTCYSPVRRFPPPEGGFSLDLHVLSAPPAFVLSQDQTLREEWSPALGVNDTVAGNRFTSSSCVPEGTFRSKAILTTRRSIGRRGVDVLGQTRCSKTA